MSSISSSEAAAILGRVSSPAKAAAARINGTRGGRPREYFVQASMIRSMGANRPVGETTVIPSLEGLNGPAGEVVLRPGQWLEIVRKGSRKSWRKALIRQNLTLQDHLKTECPPVTENPAARNASQHV